jgi:hypothetical protein
VLYGPKIRAKQYGLYEDTLRNILQQLPQFLCQQMLYGSLGMHNTLKNCSCCPPQFLCTLHAVRPPQIHTVRPVPPCCLKSVLLFALGCVLSFSKCCLFSQLNLSLSLWHLTKDLTLASHQRSLLLASHQEPLLLASHQEFLALSTRLLLLTQEWVRPLALVDLMREGEGFSNLTAEIRLDGWLRFGVSSLTLSLIIKTPFNLHLTN